LSPDIKEKAPTAKRFAGGEDGDPRIRGLWPDQQKRHAEGEERNATGTTGGLKVRDTFT